MAVDVPSPAAKKLQELESLNDRERRWAYDLEEAIYGDDTNTNTDPAGRRHRSTPSSRFRRSRRSGTESTTISAITTSSFPAKKPSTVQYGKPSDLEIAAHAIRAKGDTAKALHRMRRLKQFKDRYGIPDFVLEEEDDDDEENEDAPTTKSKQSPHVVEQERILHLLQKFLTAYPNFLQRIGLDPHNRVVIQFRLCALRWTVPPPFNHSDEERFAALYYLLHALQPTLDQIRMGTVWIGDLEGMGTPGDAGEGGGSVRPTAEIYHGGRLLLRDSYPLKVDDIPCVDGPSKFSTLYLSLYPFLSRHFLAKYIHVTPEMLRHHFPAEFLSDRLQGNHSSRKNLLYHQHHHRRRSSVASSHPKKGTTTSSARNRRGRDQSESDWENLNEDSSRSLEYTHDSKNTTNHTRNQSTERRASASSTTTTDTKESGGSGHNMWITIERLLKMRFETERTFRLYK